MKEEDPNEVQTQKPAVLVTRMTLVSAEEIREARAKDIVKSLQKISQS